MAKLNRIRIINFYYNNDIRQIADETFSFYGGENALLNLANGGGKSVLIQLILQPVIPDYTIQKRTMSSYFKKNTQPAYIMLEWILDNPTKKDYLMTGIAISPKINNDENASNSLNYFTFASHYSEACEFDLGFVPFSKKENGKQTILPFDKAREAVRNMSNKHSEISYYGKDDAVAYRNKLAEFRISQEEWKNIIARMNNDEGGIDELFEKCSTSNKLIDEWIVKTVEKAVMVTGTENTQVYELMEDLVNSTISNEEHIRNRKHLLTYLIEHVQLEKSLEKVCNKLEEYDAAINDLNHLYSLLRSEANQLELDLSEIRYQRDDLEEEQTQTTKEEKSEKYYDNMEKYNELEESEKAIKSKLTELQEQDKSLKKASNILLTAKKYEKCCSLQGEINALMLQLKDQQKNGNDTQKRIYNLKYSLKLLYQQQNTLFHEKLDTAVARIDDLGSRRRQAEIDQEYKQNRKTEIAGILGNIQSKISTFEEFQENVCARLKISVSRDLLGNLSEKEISDMKQSLDHEEKEISQTITMMQTKIEENNIQLTSNQIEKEQLINEIADLKNAKIKSNEILDQYRNEEHNCILIMEKYDVPKNTLFHPAERSSRMNALIAEREKRHTAFEIELSQMKEMISGIKEGQVYFPQAFADKLQHEKVIYQTGERYLNELTEDNRKLQLAKNPLLPFGIIIDKKDLKKLENFPYEEVLLRQIVPVFTYEGLRNEYVRVGSTIHLQDNLTLISSYETKLFDSKEREVYLLELERTRSDMEDTIDNLNQELSLLRDNARILRVFQYEEDYQKTLDHEIAMIVQQYEEKNQRQIEIMKENELLSKENDGNDKHIEENKRKIEETKEKLTILGQFLEKNYDYMGYLAERAKLYSENDGIIRQISQTKSEIDKYHLEQNEVEREKNNLQSNLSLFRNKLTQYENAENGEVIDGAIEILEHEYENLVKVLDQSIQELENKLSEKKQSLIEYEAEVKEFGLLIEDYEHASYDEAVSSDLKEKIIELSGIIELLNNEYHSTHDRATEARANMKSANKELEDIGMEQPLPKTEIMQDYVNRRKRIKFLFGELKGKENSLQRRNTICETRAGILTHLITPDMKRSSCSDFTLEEDIEKQSKGYEEAFKIAKNNCSLEKENYQKVYKNIKAKFDNVHNSISDILNSLERLDINSDISYEKVYFFIEELMKKRESLEKLLAFYDQQLSTMEDSKRQVIEQCISYAILIYDGIKIISEKSKIRLTGKSRSMQMLKIGIPPEIDSGAGSRMKEYIESTLRLLIDYLKKEETKDNVKKYKEKIRNLVSTRQLLNQLIGKEQMPVSIYKIELNENNSGMKSWEDAMKENSGGEKFVCFFTVASTLISYTREATSGKRNEASEEETKVMIMDNPFARTSSEHLLKAVIDIARTFHIQLICLSDLSQSSITNRFSVIYTLSVRQKMYSDKEVLHIENILMNKDDMTENERLEHVSLYQKFEQGNLFDLIEE